MDPVDRTRPGTDEEPATRAAPPQLRPAPGRGHPLVGAVPVAALVALLAATALPAGGAAGQASAERAGASPPAPAPGQAVAAQASSEIVSVVEDLFRAIAERDTALARSLFVPEAPLLSVRATGDTAARRFRPVEEFVAGLAGPGPELDERMWDPEITMEGPLATLRAPYDFRVDGEFSHCGIDVFHLVRTAEGWKLAAVVYTVVEDRAACPEPERASRAEEDAVRQPPAEG